jgi:antitoxin ParD1/3/4
MDWLTLPGSNFRLRRFDPTISSTMTLPNFANVITISRMSTMNISLPDALKDYVDEQVAARGYGTSSEYVRDLIRKDQDRMALKALVIEGLASPISERSHESIIEAQRQRIRKAASR